MADYNAQAAAIYDPQQQAEAAGLQQTHDTAIGTLEHQKSQVEPAYQQAAQKLLNQTNQTYNKTNLTYSNALSGMNSGLQANAQRLVGVQYQQSSDALALQRQQKLDTIALKENQANQGLASGLAALNTKYSGLKNEYIQAQQQADAQRAALAASYNSGRSSGGGGGSSAKAQPYNYNANSMQNWISYIHSNYHGQSWGAIASQIERNTGTKIPTGSALDQALHYIFTGRP